MTKTFGRYKVSEEVGRGAMGVVYRGIDPMIGRAVAIKAINVSYLDSVGIRTEEYLERFQREAQVAGRLNHPGIVKIYDLGTNYLVMEFVEGQSLASLLQAKKKWPLSQILQMIGETADALDYAHGQGIVHRDVKPANIMLQPDGSVKVMDFGLARIESSTLTAAGEILGSASYMAPEMVLGRTATPRSDIFSLAVVVYELMTGDRPFAGGSVSAIIHNIVSESPRATGDLALNLPPAYDAIFARALAKDPGARHATATEFAGSLAAAQWADRDPMLPDPKEVAQTKRLDPGATIPPVAKEEPGGPQDPTVMRAQPEELPAAGGAAEATMMTVDAAEVALPAASAEESPLANLVSEPPNEAVTLRAMPPLVLPEDAMSEKKNGDEASSDVPATVIMKPGAQAPAPPPAAAQEASSDMPATVILKPGAQGAAPPPAPPTPSTEATIITAPPAAATDATGRMSPVTPPAPPASQPPPAAAAKSPEATAIVPPVASAHPDATAAVRPKTPPPPPAATAPPPVPPPPPADTGRTGPIPLVAAPAGKPKRSGLVVGLVVAALLLLAVVSVVAVLGYRYIKNRASAIASLAPEAPATTLAMPPPTTEPPPPAAAASPEAPAEAAAEPTPEPSAAASQAPQAAPSPASVMITSVPPGARILVGKKERGVTPSRLTLPPGKAAITVEKEGFNPWRRELRLAPGKQETLEARLEPVVRETPRPPAATPAPVKTGDLVALGPDVTPPKKLSGEGAQLPSSVRNKKLSASVVLEFVVDESGNVRDPRVVESGGDAIDGACLDAVKKWRYEPATLRGVRVKVVQKARFTFQSR